MNVKMIRTTMLAVAMLALSAAPVLASAETPAERPLAERLWYAQGLTHPIVVHIPIGLLMAAAIAAVLRVVFRKTINIGIVYFCLLLGTGGAVLSSLAGWAWAPMKDSAYVDPFAGMANNDIFLHRWGGVSVTVLAIFVLIWATISLRRKARFESVVHHDVKPDPTQSEKVVLKEVLRPPGQFGWQAAVVILAGITGWVGHEGGELVYPKNFENVMKIASGEKAVPLQGVKVKKTETVITPAKPKVEPTTIPSTNPATGTTLPTTMPIVIPVTSSVASIDFAKDVAPIFAAKCIYCHGTEKSKGKLKMHTEADSLKGGDAGPLYIAGDPAGSDLIKRITTEDPDEVMPPPKEKKTITPEELAILKAWVTQGAKWNVQEVIGK